jgi:hypothetical protein
MVFCQKAICKPDFSFHKILNAHAINVVEAVVSFVLVRLLLTMYVVH